MCLCASLPLSLKEQVPWSELCSLLEWVLSSEVDLVLSFLITSNFSVSIDRVEYKLFGSICYIRCNEQMVAFWIILCKVDFSSEGRLLYLVPHFAKLTTNSYTNILLYHSSFIQSMSKHILLTGMKYISLIEFLGGNGYIASHTAIELLKIGYKLTLLDNFCNSR